MNRLQTEVKKATKRAIKLAGGPSALAASVGELPQTIVNWRIRGVPPAKCIAVELAVNGQVTRYELQPKVFGKAA